MELADKLYTSTQVADILGVSLRTLYRYMEDGKINSMRTASGRHRFTKDQIIEFLNAGQHSFDASVAAQTPQRSNQPQPFTNQQFGQQPAPIQPQQNLQTPGNPSANSFGGLGQDQAQGQQSVQQPVQQNPFAAPTQPAQSVPFEETGVGQPMQDVLADDDLEDDILDFADDEVAGGQEESVDFQSEVRADNLGEVDSTQGFQQQPVQNVVQEQVEQHTEVRATFEQEVQAPAPVDTEIDLSSVMNIRYYKSDYTELIELAKKIKETSTSKDLEYAFTLMAGLSLHFLLEPPFTILHIYANPEDMQIWKDELRLVPSQRKEDANLGVIINTDIVFVPSKEIGGFRVVEDKVLLKDLSTAGEEDLVKRFRQHLTAI